jgi:hypothetical protein
LEANSTIDFVVKQSPLVQTRPKPYVAENILSDKLKKKNKGRASKCILNLLLIL